MSQSRDNVPSVPDGWKAIFDEEYRTWYYVDLKTGKSQWEPPKGAGFSRPPAPPPPPPQYEETDSHRYQRQQPLPPSSYQQQQQQQQGPMIPPPVNPQAIDDMIRRAPPRVTTVYIGNIPHFATEADLIPLLQNFGFILDFTHYPEKGCCFIKYDTHEQAAVCIVALANFNFQGRNLRTGWGKERTTFIPQGQPGGPMPMMMGDGAPQPEQVPASVEQTQQNGQELQPQPQQQ